MLNGISFVKRSYSHQSFGINHSHFKIRAWKVVIKKEESLMCKKTTQHSNLYQWKIKVSAFGERREL